MKNKKIALDVDDVLAAFTPHAFNHYGKELPDKVHYWCSDEMNKHLGENWFTRVALDEKFWKALPTLANPLDIDFHVECYISSFPMEMYQLRLDWFVQHGFPNRPLYVSTKKLETCLALGIDLLVDDKPETIKSLQDSSVKGLHYITPYAGFEIVGDHITNLKQVKDYL